MVEFTQNDIDRFFIKTKLNDNGCLEWTAGCDKDGYGLFK